MNKNEANLKINQKFFSFSKFTCIIFAIMGVSLIMKFYFYPTQIPLSSDALYYFWYSSEIYQIGELPKNWTPPNNAWPIFTSFIFNIFGYKEIFTLMEIQKILSVLISVVITIPIYFLCKKFVSKEFAIIGASFVAFDPRLMINSFLGLTDPLFLLLITTGLVLFLSSNKKLVLISFVPISLATITRGEGIIFLIFLLGFYFIKYRKEKFKNILNYVIILTIISLIIIPITMYRIDASGHDPIFLRSVTSTDEALTKVLGTEETDWNNDNVNNRIFEGSKTFLQFLVWITIPNFIIFLPLGIFLIFKHRNFKKDTLIFSSIILSIPVFYAYTFPAQPALDTRYLFTLFPIFSVLSVIAIEKIIGKTDRKNTFIVIIISAIIFSSILFYDYKKIDYEHEKEAFQIMNDVYPEIQGINKLPNESRYFITIQTIEQWPEAYSNTKFDLKIIPYEDVNDLEYFILNSKDKGLTHIITDNNENRPEFLKELFFDETKYQYLKKIYDSSYNRFEYQVKVFEINYELFDSLKNN